MASQTLLIIIASLSFLNSAMFTFILYRFNRTNLRTAGRQEHNRLLLEIDKYLIEHDELWALWDAHRDASVQLTPHQAMRVQLFVVMITNIYETVYEFYHSSIHQNAIDRAQWLKWDGMIRNLCATSTVARAKLAEMGGSVNYAQGFTAYLKQVLADTKPS